MNANNAQMMDRFLATDCPLIPMPHAVGAFEPLSQPGHRLIMAADGVYKEIRRAWLYAVVRVAEMKSPFGELAEQVVMPFRVPPKMLARFLEQAHAHSPLETGAWVVWNEHFQELRYIALEAIQATPVLLQIHRPILSDGEHLVLDMHSHHSMSAKFSPTDDEDDIASNEVKIAGVVGRINTTEEWNFRLCLEGVLMQNFLRKLEIKDLP